MLKAQMSFHDKGKMRRNTIVISLVLMILYSADASSQIVKPNKKLEHTPKLSTQWTDSVKNCKIPLSAYPRPQLRRRQWLCLNGKWDYMGGKNLPDPDDADTPIAFNGHVEKILVPFPPESYLSGIDKSQEINMWYKRSFVIPDSWKGSHIMLNFGAVDNEATIFVNGLKVGTHQGGYDSFSFDITKYLKLGKNILVVGAHDSNNGEAPSGKNGPRGDYTFTSGIWQTVWLEPVNKKHITTIFLCPELQSDRLKLIVNSNAENLKVTATALQGKLIVSRKKGKSNTVFYLPIIHPETWSPSHPFLYDLIITLKNKRGRVLDKIKSYFGMRSITLGKVNGVVRPLLNGHFVFQLGVLDQGYWPDGIYTAPTDKAIKFDISFAKRAGFNLIREHMKVEPQRWYYWADKLGMLVWQDMPAMWYPDKDTTRNRVRFRKELKTMIDQHYNSPSIITWVPFNENWGAFDVKSITAWVKKYDLSRLVDGNSGFNNCPSYQKSYGDPGNGDFIDKHIYVGPYGAPKPSKTRAAALGEFGGVGLFVRGHLWPVQSNAYKFMPTKKDLTDEYVLLLNEVDQLMKYKGLSVAIYTQLTDVEHEIDGLLTYDREVEKMNIKRVKAINSAVIRDSKSLQGSKTN